MEIGNSPIYTECTKLAISTPNTWSDTEIEITVREGSFTDGEQVYLFVVDSNGDYSDGYGPLIVGEMSNIDPTLAVNNFSDSHNRLSILPMADKCIIRRNNYSPSMSSENTLNIYTISGTLLEQLNEINGEFIWNTSSVHNGLYIMKLVGSQNYPGQKYVLIK